MNDKEMLFSMNLNIKGKFSFIASRIDNMNVFFNENIQYIDCGYKSDTFNTIFGIPSSKDIIIVTEYYNKIKSPAAWWFSKMEEIPENNLTKYGWNFEETDIGMYLKLDEYNPKISNIPLNIVLCKTKKDYIDFGKVLSSIFEPDNMEESKNIQIIYSVMGDNANKLTNNLFHFVGFYNEIPVTTASVYFSGNNAGIFDIATPVKWRKRGFGSAIFKYALNFVKNQKIPICFLQASQDGLNIYKSVGFKEKFKYEVWGNKL